MTEVKNNIFHKHTSEDIRYPTCVLGVRLWCIYLFVSIGRRHIPGEGGVGRERDFIGLCWHLSQRGRTRARPSSPPSLFHDQSIKFHNSIGYGVTVGVLIGQLSIVARVTCLVSLHQKVMINVNISGIDFALFLLQLSLLLRAGLVWVPLSSFCTLAVAVCSGRSCSPEAVRSGRGGGGEESLNVLLDRDGDRPFDPFFQAGSTKAYSSPMWETSRCTTLG